MNDYQFPIEAGHIMMFARAIGETNPAYFEASRFGRNSRTTNVCPGRRSVQPQLRASSSTWPTVVRDRRHIDHDAKVRFGLTAPQRWQPQERGAPCRTAFRVPPAGAGGRYPLRRDTTR